ncbi:hypothetical protein F0562_036238 [Nyssa sinensis]|uniref:Uncharacterized protein n=1 Tax=Nyssa sinensis TaxID=561372 RepID=A0A5J5AD52_9ASTE|nr:hypothetical protein F0562_036238 [Nyssa sinensis]
MKDGGSVDGWKEAMEMLVHSGGRGGDVKCEDAEKLRIHTHSEVGDMDSLEKMVDGSDSEDSTDGSSTAQ